MNYEQKEASWKQHCEDKIKIITNVESYNPTKEKRFLIPFINTKQNSRWQRNKMGLLNKDGKIVLEPFYDIILDDCYFSNDLIRIGTLFPYGYARKDGGALSYVRYKYRVINTKGELILDKEYDSIMISSDKKMVTVQNIGEGYAVYDIYGNEVIPFGKYSWIDAFDHGLARVKSCKWGIINNKGIEVTPLIYDSIWNFYGKNRITTKAIKDDVQTEIYLHDLSPDLPKQNEHHIINNEVEVHDRHYGKFAGSYAQDVMGYSDEVINDAFEGDSDAYWNID